MLVPSELGVPECDPSKPGSDDISGRRSTVTAEIETGLRHDVRVPPAVENDPRNVTSGIESRGAE